MSEVNPDQIIDGRLLRQMQAHVRAPAAGRTRHGLRRCLFPSLDGVGRCGRLTDVRVQVRSCRAYDAAQALDRHPERRPEDRP